MFQERDTACCLREDQAGCVQTQKSECKGGCADDIRISGYEMRIWEYDDIVMS